MLQMYAINQEPYEFKCYWHFHFPPYLLTTNKKNSYKSIMEMNMH